MLVKICGITNKRDALLAAKQGADILGFIFAKSPRQVEIDKAAKIIKNLPKGVKTAGVFVNEKPAVINRVIKATKIDMVQLSGEESPAEIRKIKGAVVIKAIRVKNKHDLLKQAKKYGKSSPVLLLDTFVKGKKGGTGKPFDWEMIGHAKKACKKVIVAGGINPGNVAELTGSYNPYGIDVSSGVEEKPGKKSPAKMKALFKAVSRPVMKDSRPKTQDSSHKPEQMELF
jgi:phosphoribosylanthranilate isomerase